MFNWLTYKVLAWIAGTAGVAVLGLSVALWAAGVRIDEVKVQRDAANVKLGEAIKSIKEHRDAAKLCSDKTDALRAAGDANKAEAAQELARLRKLAERYQASDRRLALLTAGPTPSGAGCATALGAIRRELRK